MGPLTPIILLRLLALATGLRHNVDIGQPGLCFSAHGHKFGINHLVVAYDGILAARVRTLLADRTRRHRAEDVRRPDVHGRRPHVLRPQRRTS
jgi:hypothetical protein